MAMVTDIKEKPIIKLTSVEKIATAIIANFDLDNPVDQVAANRMANIIIKMKECERAITKYGLIFEMQNTRGEKLPKVNEVAYYIKQLEAEFRSYLRLFKQKYYEKNKGVKDDVDIFSIMNTADED